VAWVSCAAAGHRLRARPGARQGGLPPRRWWV